MLVKTYNGRTVSHMSKTRDGKILITFASDKPGDRRERLIVYQSEWDAYGRTVYIPAADGTAGKSL